MSGSAIVLIIVCIAIIFIGWLIIKDTPDSWMKERDIGSDKGLNNIWQDMDSAKKELDEWKK